MLRVLVKSLARIDGITLVVVDLCLFLRRVRKRLLDFAGAGAGTLLVTLRSLFYLQLR